ncbi:Hypothetical protein NTJ_11985 [Nesidiocoris tenuis]|uniref:Uncharacterized protein n=2 Tax=Nesidiocoris tenuis TaxID=355587 RepID=A0ABN7B6B1_9HEMI|nr:Hypothetical protein NTJ_11985 [Nesidiocoris tenuis]
MATDLDRFYEKDLDRTNVLDFYNSLPGHLQSKFRKSTRICLGWGNVLQGYRGPSHMRNNGSGDSGELGPSNGLQEIKHWWGARKDLNSRIPVLGTAVFGLGRVVQKAQGVLEWGSLFFDSKTGECLSHDKNEASDELHKNGRRLFDERKYSEAREYFSNAYQSCSSGYLNERTFKNAIDEAQVEIEADNLNSSGNQLFEQGKYVEAVEKYREARVRSKIDDKYGTYRANEEKAESETEASILNSHGDSLFSHGEYDKAYGKYSEAYEKSNVDSRCRKYATNRDKARMEVEASQLSAQGDVHFEKGEYRDASEKYRAAYEKSDSRYDEYRSKRDGAEAELMAADLNSSGDQLYDQGEYGEAHCRYRRAFEKSKISKATYRSKMEKAESETEAVELNKRANDLFELGKYREACAKYCAAFEKSQAPREKNAYLAGKNNAQSIVDKLSSLETTWNKAWEAEVDDREEEARRLFQKVSSESEGGSKFYPNNTKFKQFANLSALKIEGNTLFNEGLVSQQIGIASLRAAQELKSKGNHRMANRAFEEARRNLEAARAKFENGAAGDVRFSSCADFVQEHLDEIIRSIKLTDQQSLSSGLNNLKANSDTGSREGDASQENKGGNYFEHV